MTEVKASMMKVETPGKLGKAKAEEFRLPEMPHKNSLVAGSLVLWKILSVYLMGVLFIARMPWFLVPVGWAMVAAAFSGCLVVGMDCSRSCFFESKVANELIGSIVLLPLLRSVESLKTKTQTSAWMSRLLACLKTSMSQKRYVFCLATLVAGALVGCWYQGLTYVVKYWAIPFLYMHFSVGTFRTKSTERSSFLALFPDVKEWAQMEKGMVEAVEKASEYIPVYDANVVHGYVKEQFDLSQKSGILGLPTAMTRVMLLRGKRDFILAAAALISLVAFQSAGAIALAVVCFGYCGYSALVEAKKRGWWDERNTPQAIYITLIHLLGVYGLSYVTGCQSKTLLFAAALWPFSGIGITGGAHRLWAHRSYEASLPYRCALLVMNAVANQGSIYRWARDHRVHHMCAETEADPHNALRGFFFAHMGWLYLQKDPKVTAAGKKMNFDDLLEDGVVWFQHKCDPWFNLVFCFVLPTVLPAYFWGESAWHAFFVAGILRYLWVLHCTWCVNSVAHLWGDRPYEDIHPAENFLVSIGAVGEGWHNWHHAYPYDYAASELGCLSQYNPTKLFIDIGAWAGVVKNRKRATGVWAKKHEKMVNTHLQKVKEEAEAKLAEGVAAPVAKEASTTTLRRLGKGPEEKGHVEVKPDGLTIKKIRASIPAELFVRSTFKSFEHLFWDVVTAVASAALAVYAMETLSWKWMAVIWPAYWWYQGLNGTAIWVIAHECGHGGFVDSKTVNDITGFILHSFLLTPYFSWAITHAKHHRRTNHLDEGETWVPTITRNPNKPKMEFMKTHLGTCIRIAAVWLVGWWVYLFVNATGARQNKGTSHFDPNASALFRPSEKKLVKASNVGMVVMTAVLLYTAWTFGVAKVIMVYLIPQTITNIYLTSITFMQHTHPDVPHMQFPEWDWLSGALCTIDRSMGKWADAKLHHITDSHVVHHLFSDMPFYGAKEATPYVRKMLRQQGENVYKCTETDTYLGYWRDFYFSMKESLAVVQDTEDNMYWFK